MEFNELNLCHTLIICSRDRVSSLLKTLQSVLYQDGSSYPHRIILVLNLRSDQDFQSICRALVELNHSNTEIILTTGGLPSARNLAIKALGETDVVHFLDDDVTVGKTYFRDIEFFLQKNPQADGGAPIECEKPSKKSKSRIMALKQRLGMYQDPGKVSVSMRNYWGPIDNTEPLQVDWLPGLAMFYRKSVLIEKEFHEKLEGFTLGPYGLGEDLMFTLGLTVAGYNLYALPNLEVVHAKLPNPSNQSTKTYYAIGELRSELFRTYPERFKKKTYLISIILDALLQTINSPLKLKSIARCCYKEIQGFYARLQN